MNKTDIQLRLEEMGIYILDPENQERFLAGKLLVVDRTMSPSFVGTADIPHLWLTEYIKTL